MPESKNEASIASIPFFKSLPPSDLMAILGITSSKIIAAGENLFDQKDPSDGLYVLLSGKLQIYIFSGFTGGAPKILKELSPGEYVGEMGLLDGQPRSASVKALEISEVMLIPSAGFAVLLESHVHIAKVVTDALCDLINNQPKLIIKSAKSTLIKDKKVAPILSNMKALCTILRLYNNQVAVSGR
jgi:CRP/FNR family cyclic AMP-dependent transcriptional regulator